MTEITLPTLTQRDDPSVEIKSYNLHKVTRRGDKIYYTAPENVTNVGNNSISSDKRNSQDSEECHDSNVAYVESRESLCKTFSFEANNDETEKCIAFWRGVVERNLKPLKCTIIESLKDQQASVEKLETTKSNKEEKNKVPKTKVKEKDVKKSKKKPNDVSKWVTIFKDLQQKRLNEVKLIARKRCFFCESLRADLDDHKKISAEELKRELKELDKFEPKPQIENEESAVNELAARFVKTKSKMAGKSATKSKAKPQLRPLKDKLGGQPEVIKEEEAINEVPSSEKPKTKLTDSKIDFIKKESEKYTVVDAIASKTKSGAYSKWRENKLETKCQCASEFCRCNQNPAIVSVTENTVSPNIDQIEKKEDQAEKIEEQSYPEIPCDFSISNEDKKTSVSFNPTSEAKQYSEDTFGTIESVDTDDLISFELSPELERELFHPKTPYSLQSSFSNSGKSEQSSLPMEQMIYLNLNQNPKLSHFMEVCDSDCQQFPHNPEPKIDSGSETRETLKSTKTISRRQRSLSVLLRCQCGEENCDCRSQIEFLEHQKEPLSPSGLNLPQVPSPLRESSGTLGHRDSFELIYRKLSVSAQVVGEFKLSTISNDSQGHPLFPQRHSVDDTLDTYDSSFEER